MFAGGKYSRVYLARRHAGDRGGLRNVRGVHVSAHPAGRASGGIVSGAADISGGPADVSAERRQRVTVRVRQLRHPGLHVCQPGAGGRVCLGAPWRAGLLGFCLLSSGESRGLKYLKVFSVSVVAYDISLIFLPQQDPLLHSQGLSFFAPVRADQLYL